MDRSAELRSPQPQERRAEPPSRKQRERCAAGSAIEILQEKWVLHIVHALLGGAMGFNELGREVGGCNPTTLTQRLAKLEELGVVEREGGSGRCGYALTPAGQDLERVIQAIRAWAVIHLPPK